MHVGEPYNKKRLPFNTPYTLTPLKTGMMTALLIFGLGACSVVPEKGIRATDASTPEHAAKTPQDVGEWGVIPAEKTHEILTLLPAGEQNYCAPEQGVAWDDPEFVDVWDRIRAGLSLSPRTGYSRIDAEIDWFGRHQKYINRVTDRAGLYLHYVVEELERHHIPMEIALLPIVESSYDPFAFSQGRAAGMWQFISSTGKLYGLKQKWWYDGRRDVRASTAAAIAYLSHLAKHYDGDWELALAAYNTGQGNVDRAIRRNKKMGKPTDFWSLKLPRETSAYVPRLLAVSRIVANPGAYGLTLNPIANEPYFAAVPIGSQIDMAEAAQLANISIEKLYLLNPGFNRWATDPRGPFELLVPTGNARQFARQLSQSSGANRVNWQQYRVVSGDTLSIIASRHRTSVPAIKRINKLSGDTIYTGQKLMIPMPGQGSAQYGQNGAQRIATTRSARDSSGREQVDYRVRDGDTMWQLSRRFKVSVKEIAEWNQLSVQSPLASGTVLSLWTSADSGSVSRSLSSPLPAPYIRKVGYTVRRGDSLSRIASKFNVNLNDILKWNPSQKAAPITPGQRLTLYVDITNFN